jgi:hypothetical protein
MPLTELELQNNLMSITRKVDNLLRDHVGALSLSEEEKDKLLETFLVNFVAIRIADTALGTSKDMLQVAHLAGQITQVFNERVEDAISYHLSHTA